MAPSTSSHAHTVVVALGGNAILQPGQVGTFEEQLFNIDGAMRRIAALVEDGWRVVLTHGNGPQVGNLLIQNALAAKTVAPMPMDVCGADEPGPDRLPRGADARQPPPGSASSTAPVVCVVTQVAVDPKDKAFEHPSKPVGPFYTRGRGEEDDARGGPRDEGGCRRRLAARRALSPSPGRSSSSRRCATCVDGGCLVVCSGGGGVPVVRSRGALVRHRRGDRQGPRRGAARDASSAPRRCSSSPTCRAPTCTTAPPSRRRSRR